MCRIHPGPGWPSVVTPQRGIGTGMRYCSISGSPHEQPLYDRTRVTGRLVFRDCSKIYCYCYWPPQVLRKWMRQRARVYVIACAMYGARGVE